MIKLRMYHAAMLLSLVILSLCSLYILFLASDGVFFREPLTIENGGKYQTLKNSYRRGELVEGKISYCKHRLINATIEWQLIDGYMRFFVPRSSSAAIGCKKDIVVPVEIIPKDVPSGEYYFTGTITYQMNPLTKVVIPISTNKFHIE